MISNYHLLSQTSDVFTCVCSFLYEQLMSRQLAGQEEFSFLTLCDAWGHLF